MLTQKTRYALRALLYLIEEGHDGAIQLQRIAETQKIPRKYLELIMLDLKALGIVRSVRGPKGGSRLKRHPSGVNFYKKCGDCHDEATCAIRRLFTQVRDRSLDVLNSVSLEDGARWEMRVTASSSPRHMGLDDPAVGDWQI